MKIVQVNTFDIQGGAARAAYRLHKGLRQSGEDSRMLVRYKASTDDSVYGIDIERSHETIDAEVLAQAVQEQYVNAHRTDLSNTLFSLAYPGCDLSELDIVRDADIINLHWIVNYQSLTTLQKLFALGKPVVWTLHDQWAFTGGCHYSVGCKKYEKDCSVCPQLADDPFDLAAAVLKDKVELFSGANLTIVTPSRWLASCAKASKLFRELRIETIPNSLETDVFSPIQKSEAKQKLGLPDNTRTLLFGAESGEEKRKGFSKLVASVQHCKTDPKFQEIVRDGGIKIICFGHPGKELDTIGIPVVSLGHLSSDELIRTAYSAADIFVLPSLEDNLPNTILESLSCGTPIVAFEVGGIPDVVIDGVTGKLVPAYDTKKMSKAIISLIADPTQREEMGRRGRQIILEGYSLKKQAQNYLSLYKELIEISSPVAVSATSTGQARLETALGPACRDIYDNVLFKSLKEYAPVLYNRWQECESDRAARLEVIHKLSAQLQERSAQLQEIETSRIFKITAPLRWISSNMITRGKM